MFNFALPFVLLLIPVPFLVLHLTRHSPSAGSLVLPTVETLPQSSMRSSVVLWRRCTALLAWLCLVVAAAQPQIVGEEETLPVTGRDLMMALDVSGSMENRDFFWQGQRLTRLDAVRAVASDFVQRRGGDRVGLILFGTKPFLQTPLTFDRQTVNYFLQDATVGLAGKSTAIGDAIGLAVKRLRDRPAESRVLILLTDGGNTAGELEPMQAAQLAKQMDVRVHTIGVGREERSFFGDAIQGTGIDEVSLKAVAELTGGRFFKAENTGQLVDVYNALDALEPAEAGDEVVKLHQDVFYIPLFLTLLLCVLLLEPWRWGRD